ncbi:MAG: hypothetical protein ACI4IQ_05215, partial [Eubacterium sp.]
MPKIYADNTKKLIIKYIAKIIISTVLSIILLNSIFSFIFLKLDIDLKYSEYIGIIVCIISSVIISFISTTGFKNNFLLLNILSVLPLLIFVIINFCINGSNNAIIIIKIAAILITAFI